MTLQLTQKEQMLLEDQKSHEEICIQKYENYAEQAQDPQLKELFQSLAQQEKQHLNTINQILAGQVPSMQQQGQQLSNPGTTQKVKQQMKGAMGNKGDASLCTDMLMTEKYVSGTYDTAIFECTDTNVREALNHIQKEEQQHGEEIFNYMQSMGMYTPK
ncbi:MAG: spore coat protein [Firmicutes bacterium]|nr:spore coat protein [Bacillota bacterium]